MVGQSASARERSRGPASLAGKIAVETGGMQGLGEAIAWLFAERGVVGGATPRSSLEREHAGV